MSKYWLTVDGHKIYDFETSRILTGREEEEMEYEYAKAHFLTGFGSSGVRISRVQTQKDMPIYKIIQKNNTPKTSTSLDDPRRIKFYEEREA